MRGKPEQQLAMLTSLSTEDLIPKDHPIRRIRKVVDEVLGELGRARGVSAAVIRQALEIALPIIEERLAGQ